MGCTSSLTTGDAEYAEARGKVQKGSKGDFEKQFSLGKVLGRGGFARVLAVRRRSDGARLAVKIVSVGSALGAFLEELEGMITPRSRNVEELEDMSMKDVVSEVASWSAVQGSKHVVNLVCAMMENELVFMVMERCGCNILRKISDTPTFWALESRRVLKEMLLGMQACHSAEIVHRDIKPENFLLGADGSTVKLCDFGLAARMPPKKQLKGMAGTMPFISPEVIKGSGYGKAADMWSYGVMSYFLCFGELPFGKDSETLEAMKKVDQPTLLDLAPVCLEDGGGEAAFIGPQLEVCTSARCTVEEALAHWYLQGDAPAAQDPSASPQVSRLSAPQRVSRAAVEQMSSEQSSSVPSRTSLDEKQAGFDERAVTAGSCSDIGAATPGMCGGDSRPSGGPNSPDKQSKTSRSTWGSRGRSSTPKFAISTPRLLQHMLQKGAAAAPVPSVDFRMPADGCASADSSAFSQDGSASTDSASFGFDDRANTPELLQVILTRNSGFSGRGSAGGPRMQPILSGHPLIPRLEIQAASSDGSPTAEAAGLAQEPESGAAPKAEPAGAGLGRERAVQQEITLDYVVQA